MTTPVRRSNRPGDETGSALVAAIAVMILGALLVSAVFAILGRSDERSRSREQRAASVAIVDHALASYEFALESNLTDETRNFLLDDKALVSIANSGPKSKSGAMMKPVSNSTFPKDFTDKGLHLTLMPTASTRWSMSIEQTDGTIGWWQTVAVLPPRGTSPNLVAYVRTWRSTRPTPSQPASVIGDARLIRAEMRPGRFSDYQMLVDGPLTLGDGLTINGRVHTNGYPDAYLVDQLVTQGYPLKLYSGKGGEPSPPHCLKGAGFSTAAGKIENKVCTGTKPRYLENTGERYDLLRGSNHLKMLSNLCTTGRVHCGKGSGPWNVHLSGSSMTATSPNGSLAPVNAAGGAVVYLPGEINLTGTLTGGALTIGVGNVGGFNVNGSATVNLRGNGFIGAVPSSPAVLGLVVEGDIIPRFDEGSCPSGLGAAVVSASGTLGIPPQFRVPTEPPGALPMCAKKFSFTGSLGTHYMPLMRMGWTYKETGYTDRSYAYDPKLLVSAPPMFPTTGPWQTSTWKDADPRCLNAANVNDPECG